MQLRTFVDTGNGKEYCLLMEVADADDNGIVDRGWGTFIVDPRAERELSHHAPHPISDGVTEKQAVGIFRDTNSRSYLMCGSHRHANAQASPCQSDSMVADCAHNTGNMFHSTNQELLAYYGNSSWNVIQWHGMAAESCKTVEVYLTQGRDQEPAAGASVLALKVNLLRHHPEWKVEVAGSGACHLNGTTNVQGRMLNGIPAGRVCGTRAVDDLGVFIHNEQDPLFQAVSDWAPAVRDTWPAGPRGTPPAPRGLTATAGRKRITLSWEASSGATGYRVKRSGIDGGPYAVIGSAGGTTFTNAGVRSDRTYYYAVSAVNAEGESPNSTQASATAK
jgi:hypothetical protein